MSQNLAGENRYLYHPLIIQLTPSLELDGSYSTSLDSGCARLAPVTHTLPDWLTEPRTLLALATALVLAVGGAGYWVGQVNSDRAEFRTFMVDTKADIAGIRTDTQEIQTDIGEIRIDLAELRGDIQAILARLPPPPATQDGKAD